MLGNTQFSGLLVRVRRNARFGVLALPLLVPLARRTGVASVTVRPGDIPAGSSATGTVTLDAPALAGTRVQLSSADPSVATVPASVSLSGSAIGTSFSVSTTSGSAGCTEVSAKVMATPKQLATGIARTAFIYVLPVTPAGSPVQLRLQFPLVVGGTQLTGTVSLANPVSQKLPVSLSSNNPQVTVPSTVSGFGRLNSGTFTISTTDSGRNTCAVITATQGSSVSKALLKIVTAGG